MLGKQDAVATVAVKDLAAAKRFYEGALGLKPIDSEGDEVVVYESGNSRINVYRSQYAGTNKATAATWAVGDDFDAIVGGLAESGTTFEHYDDLPETTREGDIHTMGDLKAVWFKDPDGNILNVVNMQPAAVATG